MKGLVTLMRCTRLLSCISVDKSPDVLRGAHVGEDVALTFLPRRDQQFHRTRFDQRSGHAGFSDRFAGLCRGPVFQNGKLVRAKQRYASLEINVIHSVLDTDVIFVLLCSLFGIYLIFVVEAIVQIYFGIILVHNFLYFFIEAIE